MNITSFVSPTLKEMSPDFFDKIVRVLQAQSITIETDYFAENKNFDLIFCDEVYLKGHPIEKDKHYFINSFLDQLPPSYRKNKNIMSTAGMSQEDLALFINRQNKLILSSKVKNISKLLKNTLLLLKKHKGSEEHFLLDKKNTLSNLKIELINIIQKRLKIKEVRLLDYNMLLREKNLDDHLIIPLGNNESTEFMILKTKNTQEKLNELKTLFIQYSHQVEFLYSHNKKMEQVFLWHSYLENLNLPIALISDSGDLLKHNVHFSRLNLTTAKCLNLENSSKITLGNGLSFKVLRKNISNNNQSLSLFVFLNNSLSADLPEKAITNQDLGIISSSIAHELNNPLAGIMAAISLLSLDDNWSNEARNDLEEMKRGSERSKILVETFLGFSRVRPGKNQFGSFQNAFDQALNLVRFRIVENNIKFHLDKNLSSTDGTEVNTSIFTMIFYLILGELITSYSHHLLIGPACNEKIIKGRLWQEKSHFYLRIQTDFNFTDQIKNSKLIKHLLELEGYQLIIDDKQLSVSKIYR